MSPARAIKCPEKNQNWVLQGGATITFNAFISKAELQQTRRDCFAREAGNGPQEGEASPSCGPFPGLWGRRRSALRAKRCHIISWARSAAIVAARSKWTNAAAD